MDFKDVKSIENFKNYMQQIEYGWVNIDGEKYYGDEDMSSNNYALQSPQVLIKSKLGVCWDQVELERYFFETNNIYYETYSIAYYDGKECPTHTFLIYNENDKWYWFENSWQVYRGIYEYYNKESLLDDVREKFIDGLNEKSIKESNLIIYKYEKPSYGLSVEEFYKHFESGTKI